MPVTDRAQIEQPLKSSETYHSFAPSLPSTLHLLAEELVSWNWTDVDTMQRCSMAGHDWILVPPESSKFISQG